MKASVIICTYNRAENLRTALQLLEWQTYDDFEVIVVNGPSTDHTEEVLAEYDGKIKALSNPEMNLCMSRNIGASAASSDILCYMDDDFEPSPAWVASLVKVFHAHSKVGGVAGLALRDDEETIFSAYSLCSRLCEAVPISPNMHHARYCVPWADPFPTFTGCNMAILKEALIKIGGFCEEIEFCYDEIEVAQRIIDAKYMIVYAPDAKGIHRVANSEVRTKEYFHKDPYSFLKNYIFCIYIWNACTKTHDELLQISQRRLDQIVECGKQALLRSVFNFEEFKIYKERAVAAFKAGVEVGKKGERVNKQILHSPNNFKVFPRRRHATSMRICILSWKSGGANSGGTVAANEVLAHALAKRGHEVHVIAPKSICQQYNFVGHVHYHDLGVSDNYNPFNMEYQDGACHQPSEIMAHDLSAYKKISELSKDGSIDIVISMLFRSNLIFASQDLRWNTVLTLCTSQKTWKKTSPCSANGASHVNIMLEALPLTKVKHVHAISNFILDDIQENYEDEWCSDIDAFTVPIGVEDRKREMLPNKSKMVRFFFAGRLEERKAISTLLQAAAIILRKYIHVEFYLAGHMGPSPTGRTYKENFDAQYMGTELWNRVHFLGFIDDDELHRQYALCDIYCMPSISESFGIPFIEAAMHGKPSIGSRAGGMPEVIAEGETGLLAEPGDVDSLVFCLEQLIEDTALRERMGQAARKRYEQNFTSEIYAERMEKEFYRITGKAIGI